MPSFVNTPGFTRVLHCGLSPLIPLAMMRPLPLSVSMTRTQGPSRDLILRSIGSIRFASPVAVQPAVLLPGPASAPAQASILKNSVRKISGNMAAGWGLAHGSMNTARPGDNGVWELSSKVPVNLHFRDPHNKGRQQYHVVISEKKT